MLAKTTAGKLIDVSHCAGCEDDFYNGKNPLGVQFCWSRQDAQFGQFKLIHIDQRPPYLDVPIQLLPTCYKKTRFVKVRPESLTKEGFWK